VKKVKRIDMKKFYTSKTLWASLATVVTGLGLYFTGEKSAEELLMVLIGVVFAYLRTVTNSGLEK